MNNKNSLVKQLTTRLNGLLLVSKSADFKTRLMVANGLFLWLLVFLIQVWGGTHDYLIRTLQVAQNKAMRAVTGLT